jgi:YjbE family integral membrane protein
LLGGGAEIGSGALEHAAFWIAALEIVVVNLLLSGDNAVVIAMACRALPPRQRLWGMAIGAGTAAIVRIVFAAIIAPLMLLPYFKLIGGLALFYIAVKLLLPENSGREIEPAARLWRVVRIVAIADIVMGFDNIIAIVGVARGDVALLVIGLVLSIPIILAGAALVMALIDRFPLLVWAGAALLGWIAGEIVATDPVVVAYLTARLGASIAGQIEIAAAIAGMLLVIAAGALLRRVRVD